jgi:hypothetical protein
MPNIRAFKSCLASSQHKGESEQDFTGKAMASVHNAGNLKFGEKEKGKKWFRTFVHLGNS